MSVKTAKLLGFYGHGIAKVKVEYVGRAPLEGSDDRKLMATLREGTPAPATGHGGLSQAVRAGLFRCRPMTSTRRIPPPPERPYRAGRGR